MPTYRAYRLDEGHRIVTGEWVEADNDAEAVKAAEEMCDPEVPYVEVWQAKRLVEDIDCEDVEAP